jgi:hypothetical protein
MISDLSDLVYDHGLIVKTILCSCKSKIRNQKSKIKTGYLQLKRKIRSAFGGFDV